MRPRIDYEVIDPEIKALREAEPKITASAIGRRLRASDIQVSDDTVRVRMAKMGLVIHNNKADPAQNARIVELFKLGHTFVDIGAAVGLGPSVIAKRVAEMGLGRRGLRRLPKREPSRPLPPDPQLYPVPRTFPNGYPRMHQEIPSYVRTLPVLPSISAPEFGNEHYYNQGYIPLVVADSGDEPGEPDRGD